MKIKLDENLGRKIQACFTIEGKLTHANQSRTVRASDMR